MRLSKLLMAASAAVLFAACQPGTETTKEAAPDSQTANYESDSKSAKLNLADIPHAQLPETVTPRGYRVDMMIDPQEEGMSGTVAIDVTVNETSDRLWIHAKEMTVSAAHIEYKNGTKTELSFNPIPLDEAPSGIAYLSSDKNLPAGEGTITIEYETPYNQNLNSAYQVRRGDEAYIVTQFEPLGAREAFPSFDEPKYKVPFTLSITSPSDEVVISNTPETATSSVNVGGETWTKHQFAKTRPLPTYLIAFAVGPYDVVDYGVIPPNSVRKTPLELRGLTAADKGEQVQFALEGTEAILTALEEYFGTPYPYEKLDLIAAPDYAFGAMENPGAIVYREFLLLLNEQSPLSQKRAYNRVHSHELAHQWFGNLVTPVWWEDIWLNEAFATWMGNKGTALAYPDGNYDRLTLNAALGAMNIDTLSTTRKVREPLARSENVMDQFDGITYRKGGGVLSMFESFVGEDAFRKGVRLHMDRYADDVATGDDFFNSIAEGSGNPDVVSAMKSFVDQPGLPLVKANIYAAHQKGKGAYTGIVLSQSRYAPLGSKTQQGQNWEIPVCIAYGQDGTIGKKCTLLDENEAEITIDGLVDWVTLNQNGSGYYRFSMNSEAWAGLIESLDELNAREVLTVQDSLVAAFRAGEVDADVFLDGMSAFAAHPEYDVASASTRLLGFMRSELPDSQSDLARHVRTTYKDRYKRIVGTDTVEGDLLAPTLANLLTVAGNDKEVGKLMVKRGRQYLGLDGEVDKSKLATNMLGLSLRETMRKVGKPAYEPLLELAANGSSLEKGAASAALAATQDDDVYQKILADVVLSEDSPLTGRQAGTVLNGLLGSSRFGEQTWDWFKANLQDYVKKVPDVRKGGLPGAGGNFCSLERRDEVRSFVEENAALMPGYERSLLQTLESIELCAALKDAKADELAAALKAR